MEEDDEESLENVLKADQSGEEQDTARTAATQAASEGVSGAVSMSFAASMQWLDKLCGIAPTSRKGQLIYMFTMLLIPLIPIIGSVPQLCHG